METTRKSGISHDRRRFVRPARRSLCALTFLLAGITLLAATATAQFRTAPHLLDALDLA